MMEIKTTKYADLIPISKADYEALKDSIRKDGLHYPIITNQNGDVLDGHNRLKICQELGIEPRFNTMRFDNELEEVKFVRIINSKRRHINDYEKAKQALALEPIEAELARQRQISAGQTQTPLSPHEPKGRVKEIVSKAVGLSPTTYFRAKTIIEKGSEEVNKKLKEGKTDIATEYNKIVKAEKRVRAREEAEAFAKTLSLPDKIILLNKDSTNIEELTEIPDNSVDLIITDPPYAGDTLPIFEGLARFASKKLKEGGNLVFFFGQYHLPEITNLFSKYESEGLNYGWQLAIIHSGAHSRFHYLGVHIAWKPMLWYTKRPKSSKTTTTRYDSHNPSWQPNITDVIHSTPPDKSRHDWAQSPTEAEYIIKHLTINEHSLVVDPFLGSGAFGIAAAKLNRYFIGVEIDKETFENAKNYLITETTATTGTTTTSST